MFLTFSHASPPNAFTIASNVARAFVAFLSAAGSTAGCASAGLPSVACARNPSGAASTTPTSPTAQAFRIRLLLPPSLISNPESLIHEHRCIVPLFPALSTHQHRSAIHIQYLAGDESRH